MNYLPLSWLSYANHSESKRRIFVWSLGGTAFFFFSGCFSISWRSKGGLIYTCNTDQEFLVFVMGTQGIPCTQWKPGMTYNGRQWNIARILFGELQATAVCALAICSRHRSLCYKVVSQACPNLWASFVANCVRRKLCRTPEGLEGERVLLETRPFPGAADPSIFCDVAPEAIFRVRFAGTGAGWW